MEERLRRQLEFLGEIDKEKLITRQTYLADGSRKENDSEHAWHLAMMALVLREYANEDIDLLKVISMVLIHDLVEIDAGDTYAYDEEANKTKEDRESKASKRLYSMLPKDQEEYLRGLFDEFEKGESMEARFAHTLDKFQPCMLNHLSGGKSWREHDVKSEQIYKRNAHTHEGSEILWQVQDEYFIRENIKKGNIK